VADRALSIALPLLGILVVGLAFYAVTSAPQHAAMSIQVALSIGLVARDGSSSKITPAPNIGQRGGVMATTRYLQDGISGLYPIFTKDSSGVIYVQSQVVRSYTLGDFFEVWGNSLGPANTLGLHQNFTSSGVKDFYWDMCIRPAGTSSAQRPIPTFEWGNRVLSNGEVIILLYSEVGCG
jgi:hypothetical protein